MASPASENNVLTQRVDNPEQYGDGVHPLVLKAGEVSLHSDWILHGSEPNLSDRRRCGFAMRFLSPDVKAFNGWNVHSNHPRPEGDLIPEKAEGEDGLDPTRASLSGVRVPKL